MMAVASYDVVTVSGYLLDSPIQSPKCLPVSPYAQVKYWMKHMASINFTTVNSRFANNKIIVFISITAGYTNTH